MIVAAGCKVCRLRDSEFDKEDGPKVAKKSKQSDIRTFFAGRSRRRDGPEVVKKSKQSDIRTFFGGRSRHPTVRCHLEKKSRD